MAHFFCPGVGQRPGESGNCSGFSGPRAAPGRVRGSGFLQQHRVITRTIVRKQRARPGIFSKNARCCTIIAAGKSSI